jgi:hypothetical protein
MRPYVVSHLNEKATQIDNGPRFTLSGESRNAYRIASLVNFVQPDTRGRQKRKDAPVSENKVVSLDERAKDEQKPFLEQLLQEGARKLLQAAIENEVIEYIQFHKDGRDENVQVALSAGCSELTAGRAIAA